MTVYTQEAVIQIFIIGVLIGAILAMTYVCIDTAIKRKRKQNEKNKN